MKQKTLRKSRLKNIKWLKEKFFEKFDKLSEDKLNTKSNKNVYVRNDVITTVTKRCRGEKKETKFRKKLMIPESEISECPEFEVKSKIGNIFVNGKILEVYSVKIYKIDPYFYEHYEKKYKFMKMDVNIYYLELMFILLNMS